jgi:hypothetical protein
MIMDISLEEVARHINWYTEPGRLLAIRSIRCLNDFLGPINSTGDGLRSMRHGRRGAMTMFTSVS